ncbi:unnamed protein product, partial [Amoebophrya sp. A25]|eukprot:GSA25T00010750001.1
MLQRGKTPAVASRPGSGTSTSTSSTLSNFPMLTKNAELVDNVVSGATMKSTANILSQHCSELLHLQPQQKKVVIKTSIPPSNSKNDHDKAIKTGEGDDSTDADGWTTVAAKPRGGA